MSGSHLDVLIQNRVRAPEAGARRVLYYLSPVPCARPTTQPKRTRSKSTHPARIPTPATAAPDPRAAFLAAPRIQRGICQCLWL
ncbi:hypothetical protein VPH35_104259 [Triticum aestivum]